MDIVVHRLHLLGPQQVTLILRQVFGEAAAASAKAGAHVLLEQLSTGHPQHRLEHERPGTPVGSKRGCCKPMSKSFCWRPCRHGVTISYPVGSRSGAITTKALQDSKESQWGWEGWHCIIIWLFFSKFFFWEAKIDGPVPSFMGQSADHITDGTAPGTAPRLRALDAGARGPRVWSQMADTSRRQFVVKEKDEQNDDQPGDF